MKTKNITIQLILLSVVLFISGCNASEVTANTENTNLGPELKVYKSPTCGCCGKWIDHMNESGFNALHKNTKSLSFIKDSYDVPKNYRSCHTAVSKEGFIFEGHIPAKFITQFLNDAPEGKLGLVVPGMPVGSPGMEYQEKFNPYTIMAFDKEGNLTPFAEVLTYQEQF